ncbi:MAG: DUF4124 domain-containing protein [Burkholderiaceae bacterium]|jgi:hypothetical protein|nr:DUF4124 domain-containing protein [Burkholderiaceae bacterium]
MHRAHVIAALALLAAGLTSAWAQQSAPASPAPAASAPKPPPPPPMINRWVDAHGEVHYGDALPADAPAQTTEVGPLQSAAPEQKARADAQLQRYRNDLQPPAAAPQEAASPAATVQNPPPQDDSCAGQWARFNAAATCANQYRVVGGGLKQDVARHCPVVPQPQCPPPGP